MNKYDRHAWIYGWRCELQHAVRRLRRAPVFSLVTTLSLAVSVGVTSAAFGVFDGIARRRLPYDRPKELVELWESHSRQCLPVCIELVSRRTVDSWRRQLSSISGIAETVTDALPLRFGDTTLTVTTTAVGAEFFGMIGVQPKFGRVLHLSDGRLGSSSAAVVSERLWNRVFHRSSSVLGQPIDLGGQSYAVVGVVPREFSYPDSSDFWVPLSSMLVAIPPDSQAFAVVARLRSGLQLSTGRAEMETWSAVRMGAAEAPVGRGPAVMLPLRDPVRALQPSAQLLFGGILAVFAIMCSNLVSLFLLRASQRAPEVAIRLALGALAGVWLGRSRPRPC